MRRGHTVRLRGIGSDMGAGGDTTLGEGGAQGKV